MTRENAKEICEMIETHGIEVIKAYGDGKVIQHLNLDGEWVDCDMPISFSNNHSFRVKPEKKLFNRLVTWFLAIGGCFSAKLETLYLSRDKQLMDTIKNPSADLVSLEDLDF